MESTSTFTYLATKILISPENEILLLMDILRRSDGAQFYLETV